MVSYGTIYQENLGMAPIKVNVFPVRIRSLKHKYTTPEHSFVTYPPYNFKKFAYLKVWKVFKRSEYFNNVTDFTHCPDMNFFTLGLRYYLHSTRQSICNNICRPGNVLDCNRIVLQKQAPSKYSLVWMLHSMNESQRIMVCVHNTRVCAGFYINFKMFQCLY